MIGFQPGTNPLSLYDELRTLAAPYTTFFSGGKFADRSQAMDQNLKDTIMSQYDKTGIMSGTLGYKDFDKTQSPNATFDENNMMKSLFTGKMSAPQFANATTLGRVNDDIDPNTGKVDMTRGGSNIYNFREDVANQGGVFGPFAKMANERNREINPDISIPVDYLRGFGRDFSQFGDPDSFRSRMSNNRFDELPSTRQTSSPRAAGAEDIKEEGIFSLGDILADLGRKGVEGFKDIAGRGIGFNVGTNAGYMLGGIPVALAGGVFGALKGGNLFDGGGGMAPDLQRSLYGEYGADSIGRLGSGIMAGYNPRAGNLLNRAVQRRQNVLRSMKNIPGYKGLNYDPLTDFINQQVKEQTKYYGGTGATDVTGSSDYTSTGSPTSMGSTHGGAGGRPY